MPRPTTLLIADDERLILALLTRRLRKAGYAIISAETGARALHLGLEQRPDLAILDVRMPDLNGLEVARDLYRKERIPSLFLTAQADRELLAQAARYGAVGVLSKPFDIGGLVPAVEAALRRAREAWESAGEDDDH